MKTPMKGGPPKRPVNRMPAWIRQALVDADLFQRYRARPPVQQLGYLDWVIRPKLESSRLRHLEQMLSELRLGNRYLNAPWAGGD